MVRYCTFLLAAAVPFLLTCINADDPFTEIENAIGELNISSPSGIPTDSLYYDSTGNPITISATLFLPSLIDSGVVTLHYQNGDSETILAELFGGDDGTDNRTLDTTLAFLRGGRIVVKMKSYIRGGYSSTDNAEMYLYRTPVRLSLLSIAGVTLTPPFNDTSVTYAATVANDRPFISIIPSIDNPYVRIFINGDTVSPNEAAKPCSLKVGANGFIVKTITDDDTTAFSYTVTVTRLPGTVATLDSISLSTGALDPAFDSATLSGYSATVEYETDTLSITAYPTHPAVTVSIDSGSGEAGKYAYRIPLEVGENPLTVKVTAEDGVTRKEYRVTVTRGKSADASLASVTLSTGTLTPEFRGDTLDYRVNIAHEVDSLAVTPVTTHSAASVTINDSAIAPGGHPWNYFPNTGVEDTVTVSVIAQDGVTERTYHLFILRPPDTTADLAEIPLSKGTLTPEFHADTIRYQVSLQSADSVVTISPKCVDENANAAIDGDTVPQTITLSTGTDSIAITVTAEDGETEKTYTVLFDRARCSDAGLALLSTSAGTLIPEFDADVKDYAVTVDESVDTTVITAQPRHDGATVKINGIDSPASITLQPMAATIVTAVVIAEDGETKSTYKITVTRKGSDLASLVGIELSAGRLVPAFDGDTLAYELRVPSDSGKIRVKPSPVHSRATVTVKGTSVGTGTWSQDITAAPGNNTSFDIVVISETGKQQKTYHIVVNRAYVLTVSNDGNGTTDPAGSVDAFIGVPQAIKAEPAIGYNFIEWTTVSGTADIAAPGDTSTSVLVQSSATIEARFELKKYLLAVTSGGNGTVEGGDTVRHGIADTIAATPADGFHFSGWRVLSGKMRMEDSLVATTTAILENGDAEVQAEFSINDYQLTVTSEGHGTVSGTGPVTHGIAKTVTAIPDTGYHFVVWKVTEGTATIADTTDASTIVTLESGDATVEGVFEINKYIVTYNGNGNTGGSLPADTSYDFGATVTVSDAGDLKRTGYTFTGWNTAADGSGTSYSPSETFTMGTSPVPLYAQWSVNQYFVAHVGNGQTSGAPHDTDFYDFGESVTIVDQGSLFREGYTFTGWNTAADGSGTDHLPSTTFAMGAASIILYAQWSVNQYFVAYVGNGHTAGAPHDTDFYDFGESVTIADQGSLFREGYTLTGWNTAADGSGTDHSPSTTFAMGAGSIILYAQWSVNQYFVAYVGNGHTAGAPHDTDFYDFGESVTIADQGSLFREGYTFTGWNTAADSSGIDYPHDTTFTIGASSITLYAKWEIKRYTVIFNSQGGSDVPALNDVAHDSLITKPDPDPILMGYTFEGWYEDDGCTNPWDFGSETVTGDDTLYVKWDIKRYTVVFNSQGGIPDTTIQVVKHGNKVTKPADPTKPDSNFVGWFKEAGCVNSWDFNNDSVVANMTLYGKWEIKQYTVVFNSQGGDPDTTMQVINYGNKAAAPDPEPTKLDSNCVGWFKEAECVNQWDFDNDSVVANMTLYGKWKIKQYTVVFNSQGGDPDTTMQLVNHGNKAAAPAPEPTKQDSIFVGWFKESECINQWDFENENVVGDTILYAKWYGYTYTVYFDDQGATTQVNPNSKTVTSPATTINVLPSPPMKTGCNFSGWYTETIGRGTEFTANAEVTEDITVYANWTITDIDGNVYHTVSIGTQTWMVENLKTTRYRDGTPLSRITDPGDWGAISSPKYCWYNNDSTTYNSDYGILYNWYTVSDTNTHRLALSGWHVPSDAEWTILTTYLGGESVAGGELKEADTSHWKSPNTGATNNTGFTARPGGERFTSGLFDGMRYYGFWWSSTEDDATYAWARPIYYGGTMIIRNSYNKHWGFSIRCVRD